MMNQEKRSFDEANQSKIHEKELTTITKEAGLTFAGKIVGTGINYLYVLVIARILEVELFGLFTLGLAIINFTGGICRLGLDHGVIRYVSLFKGTGEKGKIKGTIILAIKYSFIISVIVGVVLFYTAEPFFVPLFNAPQLDNIIKILSLSLPFSSLMFITLCATQGFQTMKYTVMSQNLFWPLSNFILAGIFFFLGLELFGVLAAYVISLLCTSLISIYFIIKIFPEIGHLKSIFETKTVLRFSLPLLLVFFFHSLIMWTDIFMLGYFQSSKEVGVYNAAMKTALLTSLILISFNSIFAPIISDLHSKGQIQKLQSLFKSTTRWIYMMSLPLFLLIALFAKEALFLFGEEFTPGWSCLVILSFAQLINSSSGSVGTILTMTGRQDIMMYNTIIMSLFNIILNYLLIPRYGIIGASIASGLSIIIFNITMLLQVYILVKIQPYSMKFLKPFLAAAVSFIILLMSYDFFYIKGNIVVLFLLVFLYVTLYSIILLFISGIDEEDKFIVHIIKKKISLILPITSS